MPSLAQLDLGVGDVGSGATSLASSHQFGSYKLTAFRCEPDIDVQFAGASPDVH